MPPIADDLRIDKSEALDDPAKLQAFWDSYFKSIEEARRDIERWQTESVLWAREALVL